MQYPKVITGYPKNILITGGAGYLGTKLVESLQQYKVNIRVVDNLMYNQDGIASFSGDSNFDFYYGDVRDVDFIKSHLDWADVVVPLAALVGMPICEKDKQGALDINTSAVIQHVLYCKDKGKIILYPQTNSGYGLGTGELYCTEETPLTPISVYGRTKCQAEDCVIRNGGVALRLATVFGVSRRMRLDLLVNDFTYKAVTDGYIVLFEKDFKRNYIHVKDVARAFIFAMENYDKMQGNVYNVGLSDANLSKWELCQKIKEYVPNFSIQVDNIREDPDKRNYIVSNEKINKLGFHPSYSIDDGIQELIKSYKILSRVSRRYANA